MGPGEIVRKILIADVTLFTPGGPRDPAVLAATFPTEFASAADVPAFLFTPLWKLLLPTSTDPADLAKHIISTYGEGEGDPSRCIEIMTQPVEQVENQQSMYSDDTGAEFSMLKILTRLHSTVAAGDFDTIEQCDLRIRWCLDGLNRLKRKRYDSKPLTTRLPIPPTGAFTISRTAPVVCSFRGFLEANNVTEIASLYHIQYVRFTT